MRKITRDAVQAFYKGESFRRGNTQVIVIEYNGQYLSQFYLHGNVIAEYYVNSDSVHFSLAGWPTVATRERVNGILYGYGYAVRQHDHQQILVKRGEYVQDIDCCDWYTVTTFSGRTAANRNAQHYSLVAA